MKRTTLADIGNLVGVDPSVVSRVIREDPALSIRPETRKKIREAIEKLGYHPNALAQNLRQSRSGAFGMFVPDFANPIFAEIIRGADRASAAAGAVLVTGETAHGGYLELARSGRLDGLLLVSDDVGGSEMDELDSIGVPWLLVNRQEYGRRCLIIDDEKGARAAVDGMLALGHTSIGHISGPAYSDTASRRALGFRNALTEAGLPSDAAVSAEYSAASGSVAAPLLLASFPDVTAIVVSNVMGAIGALAGLHKAGVRVPQDVSIVAIHDFDLAEQLVPRLSTVRMPLAQLGSRGIEVLAGAPLKNPMILGPIELILRDSSTSITSEPPAP